MADPVISDAVLAADTAGVAAYVGRDGREQHRAGLAAAIAQYLREHPGARPYEESSVEDWDLVGSDLGTVRPEDLRAVLAVADGHWSKELNIEPEPEPHVYLSTGCLHGDHDYCAAMTGYQGEKRSSQCKFCDARCVCDCHSCPTCSGPVRSTVGMVCQTCGTDYATPASVDGEPDVGWGRAVATLLDVAERTGSPAARWAAHYLAADPDRRAATPASAGEPEAPPKSDLQGTEEGIG